MFVPIPTLYTRSLHTGAISPVFVSRQTFSVHLFVSHTDGDVQVNISCHRAFEYPTMLHQILVEQMITITACHWSNVSLTIASLYA
jgi:hypothetical protein